MTRTLYFRHCILKSLSTIPVFTNVRNSDIIRISDSSFFTKFRNSDNLFYEMILSLTFTFYYVICYLIIEGPISPQNNSFQLNSAQMAKKKTILSISGLFFGLPDPNCCLIIGR